MHFEKVILFISWSINATLSIFLLQIKKEYTETYFSHYFKKMYLEIFMYSNMYKKNMKREIEAMYCKHYLFA